MFHTSSDRSVSPIAPPAIDPTPHAEPPARTGASRRRRAARVHQPSDFLARRRRRQQQARRHAEGRELADLYVERAAALPSRDRQLVLAVYERGMYIKDAGAEQGLSPALAGRRLARLTARMKSPTFAMVLSRRDEWPREVARLATRIFLHGVSARESADLEGVTYFRARKVQLAVLLLLNQRRVQRDREQIRRDMEIRFDDEPAEVRDPILDTPSPNTPPTGQSRPPRPTSR